MTSLSRSSSRDDGFAPGANYSDDGEPVVSQEAPASGRSPQVPSGTDTGIPEPDGRPAVGCAMRPTPDPVAAYLERKERVMFHANNGLYFERHDDGSVTRLVFARDQAPLALLPEHPVTRNAAKRGYDPIEVKQRTCQECGMLLDDAGEYHPYPFCILKKAGLDPWQTVRVIAGQLQIGDPGAKPPLVRRLMGRG